MRSFLNFLTWFVFLGGSFAILWPVPVFLLSDKWAKMYLALLFRLPPDDKSAGSALPFFWMFFTAPIGVLLIFLGIILVVFTLWLYSGVKDVK